MLMEWVQAEGHRSEMRFEGILWQVGERILPIRRGQILLGLGAEEDMVTISVSCNAVSQR